MSDHRRRDRSSSSLGKYASESNTNLVETRSSVRRIQFERRGIVPTTVHEPGFREIQGLSAPRFAGRSIDKAGAREEREPRGRKSEKR